MTSTWIRVACAGAAAILPVLAQPAPDKLFVRPNAVVTPAERGGMIGFLGAPIPLEGGTAVTGAPYSAEAASETVQTLANGNRIVRKNTTQIYRDSDGRTRREETMSGVGPWASSGGSRQFISISDPTTNTAYQLDPDTKTARKFTMRMAVATGKMTAEKQFQEKQIHMITTPGPGGMITANLEYRRFDSQNAKVEDLGQKMIEGVLARGTRSTVTIPAGEIGNEQPIETVSERWYSDELKAPVFSKSSDPRFGETTYRLSNIRRAEPPADLFQVPADYRIEELPAPGAGVQAIHVEKK